MATTFWKRSLERLGERFSKCEAVELSMIRDGKRVSDASHNAYLADLLRTAASKAKYLGKAHVKGQMPDNCLVVGHIDGKVGSIYFYAPSLLTMPNVEAVRLREELYELFEAAGGALEAIPPAIAQQLSPVALTFTSRELRWAACVFDAALRKLPGITHAEMTYLQGQPRPGCWFTTLPNVMATSVQLIDWLLAADDTPGGASTGGIDAVPKQKTEAAADDIVKRLETLERRPKEPQKRPTQREKVRKQRNDFSCKRRTKNPPEGWREIYHAYNKKFPNDKDASPATLRLSHDRNCQKCRTK